MKHILHDKDDFLPLDRSSTAPGMPTGTKIVYYRGSALGEKTHERNVEVRVLPLSASQADRLVFDEDWEHISVPHYATSDGKGNFEYILRFDRFLDKILSQWDK